MTWSEYRRIKECESALEVVKNRLRDVLDFKKPLDNAELRRLLRTVEDAL